jgi:hypothetical protein
MNAQDFLNDIPEQTARAAHAGTSFVPGDRAGQERTGYADTLARDWANLAELATTDLKRQDLEREFARYREGYRRRYVAHLSSRSRIVSPMISGGSNFPVRRMEKRNAVADRRMEELIQFRPRALAAIRKVLRPELAPIMSGDQDAQVRLSDKIEKAEAAHERMKKVNRAYEAFVKDPATLPAAGLTEQEEKTVTLWKPEFSFDRLPFPSYALQNPSANIRRMKERLGTVTIAQATPPTTTQGAAARLEDCPAENRVRLFYPGKPAVEIRTELKRNGFRWTPSLECWQAYRNPHSIATAKRLAGAAD